MSTWWKRIGLVLGPCALIWGAQPLPAHAQVSAANTIAPQNTVVAQPKPTVAATTVPSKKKVAKKTVPSVPVPSSSPTSPVPAVGEAPYDNGSDPVTVDPVGEFSDTIADLAAEALKALPASGGSITVSGTASVTAAESPVKYVTAPVVAPTTAPGAPVQPPTSIEWSSVVINTEDLAQYVLGVAIAVPQSEESKLVLAALPAAGSDRYSALLSAMAKIVGPRTKSDAKALESVWLRTDPRRMKAVLTALAQVGTRYRYTGNKPGGFDCSGLTSYSWSQAGVKIPRTSILQFQGLPHKSASQLLPGDIVWHPGHVSMYLGVDQAIVDAPQTGKTVEVKKSSLRAWNTFLGVA